MPDQPDDARVDASWVHGGARLSRRTAMGGLGVGVGALLVTGCSGGREVTPAILPGATVTPPAQPDVALALSVLADERRVLDRVRATMSRHPGLGSVLTGTRAVHEAHVRLLADAAPSQAASSPDPAPSPSASTAVRSPVPAQPSAALRALAVLEHELTALDQRSASAAGSGAFARVVGSMAAAAAQQAATLTAAAAAHRGRGRRR